MTYCWSYHISKDFLILRKKEVCASGNMRDKSFFWKRTWSPTHVKCKSFLFSECNYGTGLYVLYIENFRNHHNICFLHITLPLNRSGIHSHHELKRLIFYNDWLEVSNLISNDLSEIIKLQEFSSVVLLQNCFDFGCGMKLNVDRRFPNSRIGI